MIILIVCFSDEDNAAERGGSQGKQARLASHASKFPRVLSTLNRLTSSCRFACSILFHPTSRGLTTEPRLPHTAGLVSPAKNRCRRQTRRAGSTFTLPGTSCLIPGMGGDYKMIEISVRYSNETNCCSTLTY